MTDTHGTWAMLTFSSFNIEAEQHFYLRRVDGVQPKASNLNLIWRYLHRLWHQHVALCLIGTRETAIPWANSQLLVSLRGKIKLSAKERIKCGSTISQFSSFGLYLLNDSQTHSTGINVDWNLITLLQSEFYETALRCRWKFFSLFLPLYKNRRSIKYEASLTLGII